MLQPTTHQPTIKTSIAVAGILFAMFFPTIATWGYFVVFSGNAWMKVMYSSSKLIQFAFPVIWIVWIQREKIRFQFPKPDGVAIGALFGGVVFAAMMGLYFGWLQGSSLLSGVQTEIQTRLTSMGLNSRAGFLAIAIFYCLLHSFLEEYYWRWFVYEQLKRFLPVWPANIFAALGFMSHHVILVWIYLPGNWPAIAFLSLSVAVGGIFWAWLYQRTQSLYGPWLSHLLVDAAIMVIGYQLMWS